MKQEIRELLRGNKRLLPLIALGVVKKIVMIVVILFFSSFTLHAQELNARVQINSDQIQGTNKQVFQTLQTALTEFINNKKWSDTEFSSVEKIDCSFAITLKEYQEPQYKAELQVQCRRPVFNSVLMTPLLNHRDLDFSFTYQEFETLEYNPNQLTSNLTAVITYYIYLILGMDFDSYSPMGGTPFYQAAENIVNICQSQQLPGWTSVENTRSRNSIISSMMDESGKPFRELMYLYHRQGLDEMSLGVDRGRAKIYAALPNLLKVREIRSTSPLLFIFSDAKLEEVADVFSKAPQEEKKAIYDLFMRLYPSQTSRFSSLEGN